MVFKRRNVFYAMVFFSPFAHSLSTVVKIYIFCKREQDLPFNFSLIGKIMDIACFVACVAPFKTTVKELREV